MANYTHFVCVLPCYMAVKTGLQQLQRLQRNDRSMIRWICGVKPKDRSPSSVFLTKLKIPDIRTLLQSRRLRLYGHVRRSSICIKDVLELPLSGGRSRGRPAKTWLSCVEKDMESYDLENAYPLIRAEWRKCISQLLLPQLLGRLQQYKLIWILFFISAFFTLSITNGSIGPFTSTIPSHGLSSFMMASMCSFHTFFRLSSTNTIFRFSSLRQLLLAKCIASFFIILILKNTTRL